MERSQSAGPDESGGIGKQTDIETASPAAAENVEAVHEEAEYADVETDPLGGTGGVSSGGAG